ncbi:hypothetical protein [Alkalihalobacterium elongatum]|uniref:hypothetical protein n=1 Tax=Alkalihalobacterium elongatum TaxID=2675466 RepID=UPI001C1F431D|nr:hypothetical protein [Alkalihalobacterium elongatum]
MKSLVLKMIVVGISFLLLTGFSHQNHLVIDDVYLTINEAKKTLRYDFKIKNTGNTPIESKFDYAGYHYGSIEVVVVPGKKLERYMKMMENTKYKKMEFSNFGGDGGIPAKGIGEFYGEYYFKDTKDLEKIERYAFDGKLLILDGTNVIAELPLK